MTTGPTVPHASKPVSGKQTASKELGACEINSAVALKLGPCRKIIVYDYSCPQVHCVTIKQKETLPNAFYPREY